MQRHGPTAAAVLLLLFHVSSFDAAGRPLVTDVRYFVYFAWKVAHGAVPHLSFFENKTQLATFAGALLVRVGEWIDVDPLTAIRWGYLAIAGLAGLAVFSIFRRLGRGAIAGGLGLLAYCSFGLLGVLPAVGNIPKLLMAVAASVAALLLYRRAWFRAGIAGALAFMDWQIGGLVGLAALVTALVYGTPRLRAVLRVVAGGIAGLAPFIVYYLAHGALGQVVRQVVGSSLFRGSASLAGGGGITGRMAKISETVGLACPTHGWLFYLGLAGIAVVAFRLWRQRNDDAGRLLLPLAVYHFGVVAFSLVDFQYYGDLFLLLHSVSFFLGVVWVALWELAAQRSGRPWVGAVALAIVFILARPGFLRPRFDLVTPTAAPQATLADQREVADQLSGQIADRSVAFLDAVELLFLVRRSNSLPLAYWNLPAWSHYRRSPNDSFQEAGTRMLFSTDADVVVAPRTLGYDSVLRQGRELVRLTSSNARYSVTLGVRTVPDYEP